MIWLIVGLLLWSGLHLMKRLAPKLRRGLGPSGKGLVAAGSLIGLVLMVIGYRMAEPRFLWAAPAWAFHLNNLLMLIAVLLLGLSHSKSRLRAKLRHPMLLAALVWAAAHLLVNGDLPSLILFGGLGLWALVQMLLINRAEPRYVPPANLTAKGDAIWLVASLVAFGAIGYLHGLVGPSPFPGA